MSALNGSDAAIDKIVHQEALNYYNKEKLSCDIFEKGYKNIGLHKQQEPVNLEGKCFWVPASVCHQPPVSASRHSFFVYGGVNINPRVNIVQGGGNTPGGNRVGGSAFNNVNAQAAMHHKLRILTSAQTTSIRTEHFEDGRIRYYAKERASHAPGPTRGNAYVT